MRYQPAALLIFAFVFLTGTTTLFGEETGSELWFTHNTLYPGNAQFCPQGIAITDEQGSVSLAGAELQSGLASLFHKTIDLHPLPQQGDVVVALGAHAIAQGWISGDELKALGSEGFCIRQLADFDFILLTGNTPKAVLYGVFHYLRMLQTKSLSSAMLDVVQVPAYEKRVLNHWDNLDGTVERGYAGKSIWKWDELPNKVNYRYREYARANASIGINGVVLNNVNASPQVLASGYLHKVKAIADELRPYGMQVYLSVNFASPMVLGGLPDANPQNPASVTWWQNKVADIYALIPDFGGFLVKANSEGQPGPQDYNLTHADGANMLADVLLPYGGWVMWRAFVYRPESDDRAKDAYEAFLPLDGAFRENVLLQVKNGPVDFQPREPFHPLFGGMRHTSLMPELQITQEYLGFSTHLVYLAPLFQEFLQADTYAQGKGTTIADLTTGSRYTVNGSGIAGVANIGDATNWCGNTFAQANWYAFGRMAWNPSLQAKHLAREWVEQTFSHKAVVVDTLVQMMLGLREAAVNYMTPLGLHHLMGWEHHYGPEPWCNVPGARPDWMPSYYHKADSLGIGFNRTSTGSNAVACYAEPLRSLFNNPETCPDAYLLWFHHIPWTYKMKSGKTLWEELCLHYDRGVKYVEKIQTSWYVLRQELDENTYNEGNRNLQVHREEAIWWHDACLLYFQTFSRLPFPSDIKQPVHTLDELKRKAEALRGYQPGME